MPRCCRGRPQPPEGQPLLPVQRQRKDIAFAKAMLHAARLMNEELSEHPDLQQEHHLEAADAQSLMGEVQTRWPWRLILVVLLAVASTWQLTRFSADEGFGARTAGQGLHQLLSVGEGTMQPDTTDYPWGQRTIGSVSAFELELQSLVARYFAVRSLAASRTEPMPAGSPVQVTMSTLPPQCVASFHAMLTGNSSRLLDLSGACSAATIEDNPDVSITCRNPDECLALLPNASITVSGFSPLAASWKSLVQNLVWFEWRLPIVVHDPWPDIDPLVPHACLQWILLMRYDFSQRGRIVASSDAFPGGDCVLRGSGRNTTGLGDANNPQVGQVRWYGVIAAATTLGLSLVLFALAGVHVWRTTVAVFMVRRAARLPMMSWNWCCGRQEITADTVVPAASFRSLAFGEGEAKPVAGVKEGKPVAGNEESEGLLSSEEEEEDDEDVELSLQRAAGALAASLTIDRFWFLLRPWELVGGIGCLFLLSYSLAVLVVPSEPGLPVADDSARFALAAGSAFTWLSMIQFFRLSPRASIVVRAIVAAMPDVGALMGGVIPIVVAFGTFALAFFSFTPRFTTVVSTLITLFAVVNGDALTETYQHTRPPMQPGWWWISDAWESLFLIICLSAALNTLVAITERAFFAVRERDGGISLEGSGSRDLSGQAVVPYLPVMLRALVKRISSKHPAARRKKRRNPPPPVAQSVSDGALLDRTAVTSPVHREASQLIQRTTSRMRAESVTPRSRAASAAAAAVLGYPTVGIELTES
jgi:hypothetical protein